MTKDQLAADLVREECARIFDKLSYGPFQNPAITIRSTITDPAAVQRVIADAERYRWLRYYVEHQDELDALGLPQVTTGEAFDGVIDAAIAQGAKK